VILLDGELFLLRAEVNALMAILIRKRLITAAEVARQIAYELEKFHDHDPD